MVPSLEERSAKGEGRSRSLLLALCSSLLALLFAGCQQLPPGPTATPPATFTPVATVTPVPPTATPVPLAARVNGQEILLSRYDANVESCVLGLQHTQYDPTGCPQAVLQGLIESTVIEQAATAAGFAVDDAAVDAALAKAEAELGGAEAFTQYLAAIGYTADTYRDAMRRDLLRKRMTESIGSTVAATAEQVHALLILVGTEAEARDLLAQIQGGADFASLALEHSLDASSRVAGGDLGWFARDTLTMPEIETAAFALEPGGVSDVVATPLGYAIVRVEERDPQRALDNDQLRAVRDAAVRTWLADQMAKAQIETFVTP